MHQPRPYGRYTANEELTQEDEIAVNALVRSLTNEKDLSGKNSLKRVKTLPSGRQAIALDMGGTFRVIIKDRDKINEPKSDGLAEHTIPMLFSGVITNARARGTANDADPLGLGIDEILGFDSDDKPEEITDENRGVELRITEQTRKRLAKYDPNIDLPPKNIELLRFKIKYSREFKYLEPEITGIFTFTQYHNQRPTWYSGAMAQVVQVVGGYGRQDLSKLPDNSLEQATMVLPDSYMREISTQLTNVRLPGYKGVPDKKGQFKYDYKFNKCHGVAFDDANEAWLIQISSSGVYAMPLPLVAATTTEAFKKYIQEVGDEELILLVDRFGGMPSGESFPENPQDFQAWRRAGVIIEVCSTSEFYSGQAMYFASGWSFNSKGTEGFNTCYKEQANGLKTVFGYKLKLSLHSTKNRGLLPLEWEFSSDAEKTQINNYLAKLYEQLTSNNHKELAIKYKIRRHTVAELISLSRNDKDIDYWDRLEMPPIANHNGNIAQVSQGYVYWPGKVPQAQGGLKFPEFQGKGCESFDFTAPEYKGSPVRCDTVVFGCYIDDKLQVIKYFYDERKFTKKEQSNFEEYMIVGEWEKKVTTGATGLLGNFYTSSFDDRKEVPPTTTTTKIKGEDLGYGNIAYSSPGLLMAVGSVSRSRYYTHLTEVENEEGKSLRSAVCVPMYNRDCIAYAYTESVSGTFKSKSLQQFGMPDATSYQLWTYDSIYHWLGQTGNGNKGADDAKDGSPVIVDTMVTGDDPTGFADSGDWLGLGGSTIDVTSILGKYTQRDSPIKNANGVTVGGEAPQASTYSITETFPGKSSGRVHLSYKVAGDKLVHKNEPQNFFFEFSPVEIGGQLLYFICDATSITIGESKYASFSEKDQYGRRSKWGNSKLPDNSQSHHFIGVINE